VAELTNREKLQRRFTRNLATLSARHRSELVSLLGDPPDFDNVPESFWKKVEDETAALAVVMMLLIFSNSASQHGYSGDEATLAAEGFAAERSAEFSRLWVDASRNKLDIIAQRFERGDNASLRSETLSVFGPDRVARAAENETVIARHRGSETAIEETVGLSLDDKWENGGPACPVCLRMQGKPRSYWRRFFPMGPPTPHPGCDCYIIYAN